MSNLETALELGRFESTTCIEEGLYTLQKKTQDPHPDWDWGAPKHRWRLYSQMLFQAYHSVLEQSPQRRMVVFHQFCLSGGAVEFMRRPGYRRYFGTRYWPVFAVTTAGCFEPALGSFVGIWSEELQRGLELGGRQSLQDLQGQAESRYWEDNSGLKKENDRILASREDGGESVDSTDGTVDGTVGSVGCESGFDSKSGQEMAALPISELVNFVNFLSDASQVESSQSQA